NVSTNGRLLFINGPRQQKYPYYPVSSTRFIATPGHEAIFQFDEAGKPLSIVAKYPTGQEYLFHFAHPKLDEARLNTISGDYANATKALAAVPEAYQKGWLFENVTAVNAFREAGKSFNQEGVSGEYRDAEGSGIRIVINDKGEMGGEWLTERREDKFSFFAVDESELVSMKILDRNFRLSRENNLVTQVEIIYASDR
ncbi:MAG: hypothetical protein AAFP02_26735, partial [Bacteroidota bacterium]